MEKGMKKIEFSGNHKALESLFKELQSYRQMNCYQAGQGPIMINNNFSQNSAICSFNTFIKKSEFDKILSFAKKTSIKFAYQSRF